MSEGFALARRIRSFRCAASGIGFMLRTQHNSWIHLAATAAVAILGIWLELGREQWCWIAVAVTLVWSAEGINTAMEQLADSVSAEPDPRIGRAKDAAAGAVLIAAVGAAAIGLLVLGPPLLERL